MAAPGEQTLRAGGNADGRRLCSAWLPLLLTALPVLGASLIVLTLAAVGIEVWCVQGAAIALAPVLAAAVAACGTERRGIGIALGCLLLVALPLVLTGPGPQRWLPIGALSIYVAPIAIPVALVAAAAALRADPGRRPVVLMVLFGLAFALALQPDLAQVLALTAGAVVVVGVRRARPLVHLASLLPFVAAGRLAAARPDPLEPVEHVELVFALAFARAPWAGISVSLAAVATVLLLAVRLARIDRALLAVPAYYAVLFVVSLSGLTPAPLIGFGAGPWLGFGCMLGLVVRHRRTST